MASAASIASRLVVRTPLLWGLGTRWRQATTRTPTASPRCVTGSQSTEAIPSSSWARRGIRSSSFASATNTGWPERKAATAGEWGAAIPISAGSPSLLALAVSLRRPEPSGWSSQAAHAPAA